jgi:hypothetical protein
MFGLQHLEIELAVLNFVTAEVPALRKGGGREQQKETPRNYNANSCHSGLDCNGYARLF